MIRSGRLIDRIKIERKIPTRTATGAVTDTIKTITTCRAGVENTSSSYTINADKESNISKFNIVLRTPKDINIKIDDIITDLSTNRQFNVISIVYKDRNTFLELGCEEIL